MRLDTTALTSEEQGSFRKSIRFLTDHRIGLANAYMTSITPSLNMYLCPIHIRRSIRILAVL